MNAMRMARVVCTIGPSSSDPAIIRRLIQNGMNIARLNFSHGTHEKHREVIKNVRAIAEELGTYVGILQDLQGPKIRLGMLPDEGVLIETGKEIALRSGREYTKGVLPVTYPDLQTDVAPGEHILLADGVMELKITRIEGDLVFCNVINGGVLTSRKGVNLPSSNLRVSSLSTKDIEDLRMGLEEEVDFVALSFVRSRNDLVEVRRMMDKVSYGPRLIAKIEKPQAVANINEIIDNVDAVMVARGDLGVEMPLEQVPMIQKEIVKAARKAGKEVIIATQMLMSMVASPRPTRGEVSDVANAVLDGADALMLSDESASGAYPVDACAMLGRVAAATEPYLPSAEEQPEPHAAMSLAVGRAACTLAKDVNAAAIVAYTQSGFTARAVARFRPSCPILALTPNMYTCRKLTLTRGTRAVLTNEIRMTDEMFADARNQAIEAGIAQKGDKIVITAGLPTGRTGSTNLLRILDID